MLAIGFVVSLLVDGAPRPVAARASAPATAAVAKKTGAVRKAAVVRKAAPTGIVTLAAVGDVVMLAHASWAEVAMLAGAVQLALVRGKLTSPFWTLSVSAAMLVSGAAFLIHEQNPWLFSRAAFLHHAIGWTLVIAAVFPLLQTLQPRRAIWSAGFAMTWVILAVMLFCDRDVAPIFGHLSRYAGGQ